MLKTHSPDILKNAAMLQIIASELTSASADRVNRVEDFARVLNRVATEMITSQTNFGRV